MQTNKNIPCDPQVAAHEKLFIGISGLIGAGKTTLANALAKAMEIPVFYEPVVDNLYLEDFYRDKARYAFTFQVYLLNQRFKQHQQIIWSGKGAVQDRTIYEDSIFAKILADSGDMEKRDYDTYIELFQNMSNFMRKPNLIVHLDVTPEESFERIKKRSRDCESGIPLEYLKALHAGYEIFLNDISQFIPVFRVNWSNFRTSEEIAQIIKEEYTKMRQITMVDFSGPQGSPRKMRLMHV